MVIRIGNHFFSQIKPIELVGKREAKKKEKNPNLGKKTVYERLSAETAYGRINDDRIQQKKKHNPKALIE